MKTLTWMFLGLGHTVRGGKLKILQKVRLLTISGAPETFRGDDSIQPLPLQVKPEVDIWSIGCVFSEAAVWARYGWKRVLEYRRQRQVEGKRILQLDGEHVFHDGHDVLEVVQETHEHIKKKARDIDRATVEILPLLNDMLLNEEEPRLNAKQVLHKSRRVIKAVRAEFEVPSTKNNARSDDDYGHCSNEDRPKTPPSLPPGYTRSPTASSRKVIGSRVGTLTSKRPMSMSSANLFSPSVQSATTSRMHHTKAQIGNKQDQHSDSQYGPFRSDSFGLHDLPDPPSPASSYQSSNMDNFSALSINTQDLDQFRGHRRTHRGTMGQIPQRTDSMAADKTTLRRSHTEKKPSNYVGRLSEESMPNSPSEPSSAGRGHTLPTPPASSSSNYHSPHLPPNSSIVGPAHAKHQQGQEPVRPHLSLGEGLTWKAKKKQGHHAMLKGEENLTYVNERDHVRYQAPEFLLTTKLMVLDLSGGQYSVHGSSPP